MGRFYAMIGFAAIVSGAFFFVYQYFKNKEANPQIDRYGYRETLDSEGMLITERYDREG